MKADGKSTNGKVSIGYGNVEVGFGGNKAEAGGAIAEGEVEYNYDDNKPETKHRFFTSETEVERGGFSADNSGALGLGGNLGPVNLSGSVNFAHLGKALGHVFKGVGNWFNESFKSIFNHSEPQGTITPGPLQVDQFGEKH